MNIIFVSLLFLTVSSFKTVVAQADGQEGFISLDCGLIPRDSRYNDPSTALSFISDADYVEAVGEIRNIKREYQGLTWTPYWTIRSFPEGIRNCYSLNVTKEANYYIKAGFFYGDYDNKNSPPSFDLYVGPNKWVSLDENASNDTTQEIIHVAKSDQLKICLVKTGTSVPFISYLMLRPLRNDTYVTQSGSLRYESRSYYLPTSDSIIGYNGSDVHDRIWYPFYGKRNWMQLNTTLAVNTSNEYEPPQAVIRTAATPLNASEPITLSWPFPNLNTQMYFYIYFAEIEELTATETREFDIIINEEVLRKNFSPTKLQTTTVYSTKAHRCNGGQCEVQLVKTRNSTHPPLLNAIEAYTVVELPQTETDQNDVEAFQRVKIMYGFIKTSWQGDPCAPNEFSWDGLKCSNRDQNVPPRITSLNLSSSGLMGIIAPYLVNLTQLEELDLSNNSLTGEVPDFLATIKSLMVINLSNNNLNGSVPQALLDREKDGLKLSVQGNQNLDCPSGSCKNQGTRSKGGKKKILIPVIASVATLAVVVAVLVILCRVRRNKFASIDAFELAAHDNISTEQSFEGKEKRFSYTEVLRMTNNFQRILGKGGFGVVYHGYLNENKQVAVKTISESSVQGYKQLRAEVEHLLRIHHRNLVSLIGYCNEGTKSALILEYMENGNLKEHLSGKRGSHVLTWTTRLRVATEAAQGLEYLHHGCKPPIIHRDVKTSNILLNEHFDAKLADFGLSRVYCVGGESGVSTNIAGTPGYLDPECYLASRVTEKSDVYSFGVVLLEIITNRLVIDDNDQRSHVVEWVQLMVAGGDIKNIVDPKLQEEYDTNTVWRALEVAMMCVDSSSSKRPNMSYVVNQLNECLAAETTRAGRSLEMNLTSSFEVNMSSQSEVEAR